MHAVVIASQKGGSGKTTLTAGLAVAAVAKGQSVAMVDTDPQRSLATWWQRREAEQPALYEGTDAPAAIAKLRSASFDLVLVDTPPTITPAITLTVRAASLVLIPVRPSPVDVWAVGETVAICKGEGIPFAFALTQATARAATTAQTIAALSEYGAVAPAIIHNRVIVASSMTAGMTAQEVETTGAAALEIAGLLDFVLARLDASTPERPRAGKSARQMAR